MMGFLKKRLFLLVYLFLVAIAVVLFLMGQSRRSANEKDVDRIGSQLRKVSGLRPVHDNVLAEYERIANEATSDAERIEAQAIASSKREVIAPEFFPQPGYDIIISSHEFARRYCQELEALIEQMDAGDRPSAIEEQQLLDEYQESMAADGDGRRSSGSPGGGVLSPYEGVGSRQRTTGPKSPEEKLLADLRRQRAQSIKVYATVYSFFGYDYWNWKEPPTSIEKDDVLREAWYSQVAYWIEQDIAGVITQANQDAQSVLDAPVKRLVEVSFAGQAVSGGKSSNTGGGGDVIGRRLSSSVNQLPVRVTQAGAQNQGGRSRGRSRRRGGSPSGGEAFEGTLAYPWTSRASDQDVDVFQFELAVLVDTQHVTDFVNALQSVRTETGPKRNQITVLQMQMDPVSLEAEANGGYYYGTGAVMELRLICDYFFFSEGYESVMPSVVKDAIRGPAGRGGRDGREQAADRSGRDRRDRRDSRERSGGRPGPASRPSPGGPRLPGMPAR